MNKWDEMRQAFIEAKEIMESADTIAGHMAGMLRGRLRKVPPYMLEELKRELRDFNMHTKTWK